jgi:hypothetical protein
MNEAEKWHVMRFAGACGCCQLVVLLLLILRNST